MPLHDWTKTPSGLYHDFHQTWTIYIKNALNLGLLPEEYSAFVEQRSKSRVADVLTIEGGESTSGPNSGLGNVKTATLLREAPQTSLSYQSANNFYATRANRIVITHHLGRVVAVIEVVSPGNKDSQRASREFVNKTLEYLSAGVHVSIVDPFPPSSRDPQGMHKLIWAEIADDLFAFPSGKDRLIAAYEAGAEVRAFVEPMAVGAALPDLPVFIETGVHVKAPLESTYMTAWEVTPNRMKEAVLTGKLPE